jgi:hypothetical protein
MTIIRGISNQEIGEHLKLKSSEINKGLDIYQKARSSDPIDNQVVRMSVSSKPVSLLNYGAKQNDLGVVVNVKGQTKLLRHAFIAKMPNGTSGVFLRKKYLHPGLPPKEARKISKRYSTRISDVFGDYSARFAAEGQAELDKQLKESFDFYYNQYLNR